MSILRFAFIVFGKLIQKKKTPYPNDQFDHISGKLKKRATMKIMSNHKGKKYERKEIFGKAKKVDGTDQLLASAGNLSPNGPLPDK